LKKHPKFKCFQLQKQSNANATSPSFLSSNVAASHNSKHSFRGQSSNSSK
jgi:hypothetical protein